MRIRKLWFWNANCELSTPNPSTTMYVYNLFQSQLAQPYFPYSPIRLLPSPIHFPFLSLLHHFFLYPTPLSFSHLFVVLSHCFIAAPGGRRWIRQHLVVQLVRFVDSHHSSRRKRAEVSVCGCGPMHTVDCFCRFSSTRSTSSRFTVGGLRGAWVLFEGCFLKGFLKAMRGNFWFFFLWILIYLFFSANRIHGNHQNNAELTNSQQNAVKNQKSNPKKIFLNQLC